MKFLILLLLLLGASGVFAQASGIPTRYMNDPAVDLVRNGKLLMPDEVHQLKEESRGRFDISSLNPIESSDLWKNEFPARLAIDKNPLNDMDEVNYVSPVLTPSGLFRFNVQNKLGDGKIYTMMLGKTVHSILLAKSLLRKIGYKVPDIKHLPRITLKFKSKREKHSFLEYFDKVVMLASQYWVIEDLNDDTLIIQDLIVMESNHSIYNLAVGVTSDMILGRRLFSALAVPLSIVNLTESVNLLRWNVGVSSSGQVNLFHDSLQEFQCTWDDARWITKRIEKLTREDWKEIVESSNTPKPVQTILLEKILSRRNSAMKLFKVDAEQFKIDSKVSNGVELVNGKLTQQFWPGYGSRFAYGDPDSPLSDSEIKSWVKGRAVSTLLDLTVSQINQIPYLSTDIQKINEANFQKHIEAAIAEATENNTPVEVPLKSWVIPTFRGNLILSRNIVTGTYLGTDNLVQLVDTFGVSLSAGAFVGAMGLPVQASASGEGSLVRTFAHLRPVTSMEKALKYPFRNIFIPLVKREFGKKLYDAALVSVDPSASEETKINAITDALKPFKNSMGIGESLLVTDSLNVSGGVKAGAGYGVFLKGSVGILPGSSVVSRFHVHRKSEHVFQIYRDLGTNASIGAVFDLDSLIPVLKLSYKKTKGLARVKYFSIDLNPANPNVLKNMSLLRKAIIHSSTRELEEKEETKPYILKTAFKESTPNINLLFWQWNWNNSSTNLSVTNPQGDQRFFSRQYHGTSRGKNYQAYANGLISHWVSLLFDKKAGLSESTGSNPGYSFKGSAQTKYMTLDQEIDKDGKLIEPFIRLSRIFNGWSIDRKNAEKILDSLRNRYRHEFYNAPVLNDTRKIFMYNISLNMFFYRAGIEHMLNMNVDDIRQVFRQHKSYKDLMINPQYENVRRNIDQDETLSNADKRDEKKRQAELDKRSGAAKFLRFVTRFRKYESQGKEEKANKYLLKAFSQMELNLTLAGITKLMGSENNFYVNSRIDGFREGDEDGDKAIVSNALGDFGSPNILGPMVQMQRNTEMLEGEFFIYWMMSRLI